MSLTVWTIGHSTRTLGPTDNTHPNDTFIGILNAHSIELVVDVRRYPGSRRLPHFASESLERSLPSAGVSYHWLPSLGGRRSPSADSINTAWRNSAFRGYADHVATEEFAAGLFELLMLAHAMRTVVMCAEVLWWRCHRRIIADVLVSLDATVMHIRDTAHVEAHRLVSPAKILRGKLRYD